MPHTHEYLWPPSMYACVQSWEILDEPLLIFEMQRFPLYQEHPKAWPLPFFLFENKLSFLSALLTSMNPKGLPCGVVTDWTEGNVKTCWILAVIVFIVRAIWRKTDLCTACSEQGNTFPQMTQRWGVFFNLEYSYPLSVFMVERNSWSIRGMLELVLCWVF